MLRGVQTVHRSTPCGGETFKTLLKHPVSPLLLNSPKQLNKLHQSFSDLTVRCKSVFFTYNNYTFDVIIISSTYYLLIIYASPALIQRTGISDEHTERASKTQISHLPSPATAPSDSTILCIKSQLHWTCARYQKVESLNAAWRLHPLTNNNSCFHVKK
jgi:hypothetical protein